MQTLLFNADAGAAGGGGGTTPPAPTDWVTGLNEDLRGYVTSKGFKDAAAVVESYRNFEKTRGVPQERLLTLPEKADDVEGWKQIHARLGRPEKPEGYEFTLNPELGDDKFVNSLKSKFHELGIPKTQAEGFVKWYSEHFDNEVKTVQGQLETTFKNQQAGLQKEWGSAFEQNQGIAKKAVEAFGVKPEAIDALESVMGFDGVHKLFHAIGSKLGEHDFIDGNGGGGGGKGGALTPDAARKVLEDKKRDKVFFDKFMSGDQEAVAEWNRLNQMAAPR